MPRKEKLPANVSSFVDRHGKRRYRWRKGGSQRYFVAHPNSPNGEDELQEFLSDTPAPAIAQPAHGTVAWVSARYLVSTTFTGSKSAATQQTSRLILEKFVAQFGAHRIADWRFDHIEAVLARAAQKRPAPAKPGADPPAKPRLIGGPSAAMNLRGELLPFFDYAFKLLRIEKQNPVAQASGVAVPRGGFHAWTDPEIEQFRRRWPMGTQARLAAEIILWTALRRGDASTFGRKHLVDCQIEITPAKTRESTGVSIRMKAAPQLLEAIAAMPVTGTEAFLVNRYGKPFTRAGLGNAMREWCDAAGLPHCSAHGLRKAATRRAAEHGASDRELMAIGGWSTPSEVSTYTRTAEQKRMAEQAISPVIDADLANRTKPGLANPTPNPRKT